jgi:hypothetical protein
MAERAIGRGARPEASTFCRAFPKEGPHNGAFMNRCSRRDLLQRGGALGLGAMVSAACGKSKPRTLICGDTTGMTDTDIQLRTILNYQDVSGDSNRECDKCLQFLPPEKSGCGGCKVLKGPVSPHGSCKSFAVKPAI